MVCCAVLRCALLHWIAVGMLWCVVVWFVLCGGALGCVVMCCTLVLGRDVVPCVVVRCSAVGLCCCFV